MHVILLFFLTTDLTLKLIIDDYTSKNPIPTSSSSSSTTTTIPSIKSIANTKITNTNNNKNDKYDVFQNNLLIQFLDEFTLKIHEKDASKSISQKFFEKAFSTRTFLEQLYYKGITEGSTGTMVNNVPTTLNVLKLVFVELSSHVTLELFLEL